MLDWVFWALVILIGYVYLGYPALLILVGLARRQEIRKGDVTPSVTLLIAAYNEEDAIAAKLDNTLALDYPPDKLHVVVVSDGSDDATNDIVRGYEERGIHLLALPRQGKAFALNAAAPQANSEILVFSDATAEYEPDALRVLVRSFADPQVGGVCGNQKHRAAGARDSVGRGESLYWRYDKWIKRVENWTGSITFAAGSIYAIRKELFVPIQDPAGTDDAAISSQVVKQGYRLVIEPDAVCYENETLSGESEFRRKARVVNRGLTTLFALHMFSPLRYGFYAVKIISHKLLRRLAGYVLIALLLVNVLLALDADAALYHWALAAQLAFYAAAAGGWALRHSRWGRLKPLLVPYYFVLVNGAAIVGVWNFVRKKRIVSWQPPRADLP